MAEAIHTPTARGSFAVIVPAFNEAENMEALFREMRETFRKHQLNGDFVIVDDGSTDETAAIAERLGRDFPGFRLVRHRRNLGKTEALVSGAAATDRSFVVLFDADLQHDTDEIPRFLDRLDEGWDLVAGRKVGEYEKRGVSRIYNWLSRKLFRVPVSDMNSMKAFRRDILQDVHLRHDWHRFFVVLACDLGYTATEIDITLHPRRAGQAKYSGKRRVVVGILDLVAVWFQLAFSRKPMMLFGVSGLLLIVIGVLVGIVAVWIRIFDHNGFRPVLYLVMLLETVGVSLFGLGFIAEMVAGLRSEVDGLRAKLRQGRRAGE